ncbi:MAG TPA: PqiC family protein [Magnetospirillaceae bacterium]
MMSLSRRVTAIALLSLMTACSSSSVPPPRLFVLSPLQVPPSGDHAVSGMTEILVAQTQVPDYLDRPQIVERTTSNELKLVDEDQWAERLSINVSRVVAQNLTTMVPADANVAAAARASLPYEFQVSVSLNNFELDQSGAAILEGRWSVTNAEGTKELAAANVSMREPAKQPGIAAAVEAMNANLGGVCRDIAAELKKLVAAGQPK